MKLKFEEAIAVPESERRSVADSIDFHSIGTGFFSVHLDVSGIAFFFFVLFSFLPLLLILFNGQLISKRNPNLAQRVRVIKWHGM